MAAGQWWVIAYSPIDKPVTYQYFQGTQAQAQAQANLAVKTSGNTNLTGPFATKAAAQASVSAGKANTGSSSSPQSIAHNTLTGLSAIGDFFQRLTQANTWIRVGEVLLGAILIGVAVARITHAPNAISKAVKAVPI